MKRTTHFDYPQSVSAGLPLRMHLRTDLHLLRKTWHVAMGGVIAFIYLAGLPTATSLFILILCLGLAMSVETLRLRNPSFNSKVLRYWGPLMRTSEVGRVSGVPYYLAATIIAIAIFPKPVAVLSILYLACGDPIASLFGILYGDRAWRFSSGKSLVGTTAGVVTCILISLLFLSSMQLPVGTLLALSVIGGVAGGTAELMPFEADDNFTIPVISGFVLWLGFILSGI
ncbi:MAG: SEC59/DGK1/VTE5 family protein [Oligoflexia bacterium]|nr:SEC59/DGK1/VTE5 family protein [Oligoflexia bacterium]